MKIGLRMHQKITCFLTPRHSTQHLQVSLYPDPSKCMKNEGLHGVLGHDIKADGLIPLRLLP